MKKDIRRITYPAIASAMSISLLFLAEILPSGQVGVVACTSVISLLVSCRFGVISAVYIFAATGILSFLLLPAKTPAFLYILFFGFYPVVKLLSEKLSSIMSWGIKLITVNISLFLVYKVISAAVLSYAIFKNYIAMYFLIGNIVFVVFDIGVSQMCGYIETRFKK